MFFNENENNYVKNIIPSYITSHIVIAVETVTIRYFFKILWHKLQR